MRFLVGYENEKTFATITTTKEDVDYQFWYPTRNKVIKEYRNVKDFYSWNDEGGSELVYTEPVKNTCSPKIYDLRTPLKKTIGKDNTSVLLSYDSSEFGRKVKRSTKLDKAFTTSSIDASTNVQRQVSKHGQELLKCELNSFRTIFRY